MDDYLIFFLICLGLVFDICLIQFLVLVCPYLGDMHSINRKIRNSTLLFLKTQWGPIHFATDDANLLNTCIKQ
jgi:hypothetical protein